MKEVFKDIPNYEGIYQVSNLGRVKSFKKDKPKNLKQSENTHGYYKVGLCKNGKQETLKVHRLVAIAFIKNTKNKKCVNHIDGDKKNNSVNNLEWCTYSENTYHAYKNNLKKPRKGNQYTENKKNWKLSKKDKKFIINNKNNFTQRELAKKFNVSQSAISRTQKN